MEVTGGRNTCRQGAGMTVPMEGREGAVVEEASVFPPALPGQQGPGRGDCHLCWEPLTWGGGRSRPLGLAAKLPLWGKENPGAIFTKA